MLRLVCLNCSSSVPCLAPCFFCCSFWNSLRISGWMAGTGGSTLGCSLPVGVPPVCMTDSPPGSTCPENASLSDFCSASNFEVFTDEIENMTMNSAISSVIMSGWVGSQRSSGPSCPPPPPPRLLRPAAMALGRLGQLRLAARAGARVLVLALLRRDEGHQLVLDHARVVARLDGEDALQRQGSELDLLLGDRLQLGGHGEVDDVRRPHADQRRDERAGDGGAEDRRVGKVLEHVHERH